MLRVERLVKRIENDIMMIRKGRRFVYRKVPMVKANKEMILKLDSEYRSNNASPHTRFFYLNALRNFALFIKNPLDKVTKEDIIKYINYLSNNGMNETSVENYKMGLRHFYLWLNGNGEYPENVKWMKAKVKGKIKTPDMMLTEEEIRRMIDVADNPRDKAILITLLESGCRLEEFKNIKIKDLDFDKYGCKITVSGKTGTRIVRLVHSVPYLKQWINCHPNSKPENYLWVITTHFHPKHFGMPLGRSGIYLLIQRLKKLAGINKRVHPHLFRHTRASQLLSKYPISEIIVKKAMGWVEDSSMIRQYVHVSNKDIDNAMLTKVYGKKIEEEKEEKSKLEPIKCIKCKTENPASNRFCFKCFYPLDSTAVMEMDKKEKEFLNMLTPEMIEQMIQKKVEEMLKRRK